MPMYSYSARDVLGNIKKDMMEAPNEQVLVERLQEQGLFIINFSETLSSAPTASTVTSKKLETVKFDHNKIKMEDLLVFSRQLATLLEAGVALLRSLDVILLQIRSRDLYMVTKELRSTVEAGLSLSQALSKHPHVFSQFWVSLVEVGEASGTLPSVLTKLANHVEEEAKFRSEIVSALVYPAILFVASIGAVVFFALVVAPRFEEVFASMRTELPLMTRLLLGFFKFIKTYFLFIGLGIGAAFYGAIAYIKTPLGTIQWERFLFGLPIIGEVIKLILMERFTSQMSILIISGVPILLALDIVERLVENKTCGLLIGQVRSDVREGKSMAESMGKEPFFPTMAVQMIQVGEETGELAKMFEHVAIFYKNGVATFVKRFGAIFEPFMLLFMAGVIGIVVVAIFLPLFKLGQGGAGYN